eukprot:TRINITY_DN4719_c0_g1_i11.p1 TRINITY_DN4719_c0_g1~~TRINITY_DN4719_c0_g1_i11.p1  ORF type:complete len:407 (-),score=41.62 TRINITY_DN4719_c0_g1_i11:380-1600(-)
MSIKHKRTVPDSSPCTHFSLLTSSSSTNCPEHKASCSNTFSIQKADKETKAKTNFKRKRFASSLLSEQDTASELLECHEAFRTLSPIHKNPFLHPQDSPSALANDSEVLQMLSKQTAAYAIGSYCLNDTHPEVNDKMLAVLFDWAMEVCRDLGIRRATFHLALNYVHKYLACSGELPRNKFQLLGLAALVLACKFNEGQIYTLEEFSKTAVNIYTIREIEEMEAELLRRMEWRLNPPTAMTWADVYVHKWDQHCTRSSEILSVTFKEFDELSFKRYSEFTQLIDCLCFSTEHLQYNKQVLAAAALYVILSLHYDQYSLEEVTSTFPTTSKFLFASDWFNEAYKAFISSYFDLSLEELLPGVQYVAGFMDMPFEYKEWNFLSPYSYEESLNVQTYNQSMHKYLINKY